MDQIGPMQFYKLKLLFINEAGVPVAAKLKDVNSNLIIQLLAFNYVIFSWIPTASTAGAGVFVCDLVHTSCNVT